MTSRDFCYWLQGFFELTAHDKIYELDTAKLAMIKNHLAMVFHHEIDPSFGDKKKQDYLDHLHQGDNKVKIGDNNIKIKC